MKVVSSALLAALAVPAAVAFAPASPSSASLSTSSLMATEDDVPSPEDATPAAPEKVVEKQMSRSLPFVTQPRMLDGSLAGDVGFDPFGFAGDSQNSLMNMREAEIKHGRLAMLAVVGWPMAELWDKSIAQGLGLPDALTKTGASPSLLNGGLDKIEPAYWVAVFALAGIVELENMRMKEEKGADYQAGDCGFDPLGLYPKDKEGQLAMQTKEIKHGRIAMMAILGFVAQEALYRTPVISETPMFFHPAF